MTRTRFAPSPDGNMHIGNLQNALFAYLISKSESGEFILRINDTNQTTYDVEAEDIIYKILNCFQLKYDEGPKTGGYYAPYIQSDRLEIYQKYAKELVKNGNAYYCFCDEKELAHKRLEATSNNEGYMYEGTCRSLTKEQIDENINLGKKYCIRLKTITDGTTTFKDEVFGNITIPNKSNDDQVIIKSNGYPTYIFSNVIDDNLMNITHVTRGREYISSMGKTMLLYNYLSFDLPKFIHLPHIIKQDKSEFSKKSTKDNIINLLNKGYLPEAIINYIALLGYSKKDNKEIFSLQELIQNFNINYIKKDDSVFDIKKLNWYNRQYIKKMSDEDYSRLSINYLRNIIKLDNCSDNYLKNIIIVYKNRINCLYDLIDYLKIHLNSQISYDNNCINILKYSNNVKEIVTRFREEVIKVSEWNDSSIINVLELLKQEFNSSNVYMIVRIAVTGKSYGIDLIKLLSLIDKNIILNRLG